MAWVATTSIPSADVSNYFTTTAAFQESDGSYNNVEVALLGVHVVGVVINHPEFIWATFAHSDMAPVFDWNSETASSSSQTLLFATATTSSLNGIKYSGGKPVTADQAFELFEYGVPRSKGNDFIKTSQSEPENFNNIDNLNNCVASNLTDVWTNYFYDGAIWINTDGLTPTQQADTLVALAGNLHDVTPGSIVRGSTNNANLTMETFIQTLQSDPNKIDASNLFNCFNCHSAKKGSSNDTISPLYLSHIFEGYWLLGEGKTPEEINELKLSRFLERMEASNKE